MIDYAAMASMLEHMAEPQAVAQCPGQFDGLGAVPSSRLSVEGVDHSRRRASARASSDGLSSSRAIARASFACFGMTASASDHGGEQDSVGERPRADRRRSSVDLRPLTSLRMASNQAKPFGGASGCQSGCQRRRQPQCHFGISVLPAPGECGAHVVDLGFGLLDAPPIVRCRTACRVAVASAV